MFDAETGEYLQYRHIDLERLKNVDPNDLRGWKRYYNGFFRKLLSTRDLKQVKTPKDPWTKEEKIVAYMHINAWCKENGVDVWNSTPFSPTELEELNKELHQVREKGRTESGIVTWISKRVNNLIGPIGTLTSKAIAMRERLQNGEQVPDDERFPNQAIPLFDEGEERENGGDDGGDDSDDPDDPDGEGSEPDDESPKEGKKNMVDEIRNYDLGEVVDITDDAGNEMEDAIDKLSPPAPVSKKRTHDGRGENAPTKRPRLVLRMPAKTKKDEEEKQRLAKEQEEQGRLLEGEWYENEDMEDMEDAEMEDE
jgi:hypothetical protein